MVVTPSAVFRRAVQTAEAEAFAKEFGLHYVEASAKTGDGVDDAFMKTAGALL